jgi:uncharacterized membrane protein YedE/YeeE
MLALASFICGLIFGWGLLISGMTQPEKVLGFLDIFGRWDPTMGFVMAGALAVSALGFLFAKRRVAPVFAAQSLWPTRTDIDRRLVAGAVLFGAGWGTVGLCPGPALENLATLSPRVIVFVVAMAAGMVLQDLWQQRTPSPAKLQDAALATSPDG